VVRSGWSWDAVAAMVARQQTVRTGVDMPCGMVFTVGMTNTQTHPEDRPMTFEPRRSPWGAMWMEPGDVDYAWVLDDLREHSEIGAFLDRIVAHTGYGEQPADITSPQIVWARRRRMELRWPSVVAIFDPIKDYAKGEWTYQLNASRSYVDPFDVRPDGKIMVTV
jgi:hypothetical protein